ncbi:asparagine synthase (glutamine-hydrolyzing) [Marivirga atlantica]|jgi:asparagine synthase (glutamine-hydrolysing)|uniref:asparagine synthase (glutamine-hydrolyzing) n=1 Tax=Marivirga atlantica TaxID=1548457 RepID=A0A937DI82_9BACT|nr:asparagine synthase (glutamine-hydrolyzing) [Marivirga atlantica]MBL0764765.1 asparagine synthase (glutamine-hydrolyzing) [Marivirga atlantica]
MCAIAGIWHKDPNQLNESSFREVLQLMRHRGPDHTEIRKSANVILGANRLKIIDLKFGNQPLYDASGRSLVFNGAIYNYPELANEHEIDSASDSVVLFELLKKYGDFCLEKLRGMFAFSFYDQSKDELLLARDRVGQKPLYYYKTEELFLFASEIKGLVRLMKTYGINPEINEEAIYQYLCFSNIPEPDTIYKNVCALEAGYFMQLKAGKITTTKYWDYDYSPKNKADKEEVLNETKSIISEAVKIRLRADVPIGLFLSGGWDSSVIAYEASQFTKDIKTFTVTYPFETSQNEAKVAKQTAESLGLSHEVIKVDLNPKEALMDVVKTFDQPFADSSAIPNLAIAKAASEHVKVMLNGDGGDEQFGGYRRYFLARNVNRLSLLKNLKLSSSGTRRSQKGFINRVSKIIGQSGADQYLAYTTDMLNQADIPFIWRNELKTDLIDKQLNRKLKPHLTGLDNLMHHDRKFNMLSGILVKMDRASMAHSIEARSPFLDQKLFEYTSCLPDKYKVRDFKRKYLLKELYGDKLPEEVVNGKKVSFEAPLQQWLQNDFTSLVEELLIPKEAKIYQFLVYEEVQLILQYRKYQDRNVDYIIYALLILELWLQENT